MYLNNDEVVNGLCILLQNKEYLQDLDISKCYLDGAKLGTIMDAIAELPDQIRNLNLSYNSFVTRNYIDSE